MKSITFYYRYGGQQSAQVSDEEAARIVGLARASLSGSAYAHHSVTFFEARPSEWGDSSEVTVRLSEVRSFRVYTPAGELVGEPSLVKEDGRA